MWITKNKNGEITLFYKKPKRKNDYWLSQDGKYFNIDTSLCPSVKDDNEPLEVELIPKKNK